MAAIDEWTVATLYTFSVSDDSSRGFENDHPTSSQTASESSSRAESPGNTAWCSESKELCGGQKMIFWIREIAGWALVAAALVVMRLGLSFALSSESPKIVEASVTIFASLGLLRAGIFLIRISTVARICQSDRHEEKHK
jgi:hypothetical protein